MANEREHTKGPWEVTAAEFKGNGVVAYEIRMPAAEIGQANADLISAAPELLEALEEVVASCVTDSDHCSICAKDVDGDHRHSTSCPILAAERIILKARGRAPEGR